MPETVSPDSPAGAFANEDGLVTVPRPGVQKSSATCGQRTRHVRAACTRAACTRAAALFVEDFEVHRWDAQGIKPLLGFQEFAVVLFT